MKIETELAIIYWRQGSDESAEALMKRVAEICERRGHGPDYIAACQLEAQREAFGGVEMGDLHE